MIQNQLEYPTMHIDLTQQNWSSTELLHMGSWLSRDIFIGGPNHPIDEFDFHGCLKLIQEDVTWRRVFSKMSDLSPEWDALNLHWNDIETTFWSEAVFQGGQVLRAPLTRQLMSHVIRQAREKANYRDMQSSPKEPLDTSPENTVDWINQYGSMTNANEPTNYD